MVNSSQSSNPSMMTKSPVSQKAAHSRSASKKSASMQKRMKYNRAQMKKKMKQKSLILGLEPSLETVLSHMLIERNKH